MIGALAFRVLEAWIVCAVFQLVLWAIQQRTKNAGIVDVGWAQSFTFVVLVYALGADAPRASWLPITLLVTAWSTRLTTYLISRGAATREEEGRYVDLRRRWGHAASKKFAIFFQAQAALAAVLSLAFLVPFVTAPHSTVLRVLGFAVGAAGVLGETLADAQLAAFKRNPANKGKVCDVGLWAWSRHPNYFFEWCVWLGYAVYSLAYGGWGVLGLLGQGVILASIFGVTGIPPTEAQSLRSRGEAYREYQRRVSRFVPMPPKSRGTVT